MMKWLALCLGLIMISWLFSLLFSFLYYRLFYLRGNDMADLNTMQAKQKAYLDYYKKNDKDFAYLCCWCKRCQSSVDATTVDEAEAWLMQHQGHNTGIMAKKGFRGGPI